MTDASRARSRAVRGFLRRTFPLWERLGVHITPNHYSQPIPDCRSLPDGLWDTVSDLPGVEIDEAAQLSLLERFASAYRGEYEAFPDAPPADGRGYYRRNTMLIGVDAAILHCTIRDARPRRIFEVGSGMSTLVAAAAAERNAGEGAPCEIISIDPEPDDRLRGARHATRLIERPVQELGTSFFERLERNDILFIDSSHVVRIGSDVQYEILEVLPRLRPGVLVHFHDIFLPGEYPRPWVKRNRWFWNEQYMLHAFLCFNRAFEVVWSGALMRLRHRAALEAAFPWMADDPRVPGSFWIRRVG